MEAGFALFHLRLPSSLLSQVRPLHARLDMPMATTRVPGPDTGHHRSSLLILPYDTLLEICCNLCSHCCHPVIAKPTDWYSQEPHRPSLANLSLTCRALYDIARPILRHQYFGDSQYDLSFMGLLQTLVAEPDLAKNVRSMILGASGPHYIKQANFVDQLIAFLEQWSPEYWGPRIRKHTRRWEVDECEYRYEFPYLGYGRNLSPETVRQMSITHNYRHTFLCDLLLSLATNVQSLQLECSWAFFHRKFPSAVPALPHLKALKLAPTRGARLRDIFEPESIVNKAPNLEYLEVHGFHAVKAIPRLPNVLHLSLWGGTFTPLELRNLISSCKKLKRFHFRYKISRSRGLETIGPRQIVQQLEPCYSTLEHLEIDMGKMVVPHNFGSGQLISNHLNFTALKRLVIDEMCFMWKRRRRSGGFLPELIPPSLISLTILCCSHDARKDVARFRDALHSDKLPDLKLFLLVDRVDKYLREEEKRLYCDMSPGRSFRLDGAPVDAREVMCQSSQDELSEQLEHRMPVDAVYYYKTCQGSWAWTASYKMYQKPPEMPFLSIP